MARQNKANKMAVLNKETINALLRKKINQFFHI